jgi:hypothetical protein
MMNSPLALSSEIGGDTPVPSKDRRMPLPNLGMTERVVLLQWGTQIAKAASTGE